MSGEATRDVDLTILLPAFNEASAITEVLRETREVMAGWNGQWEIVVVDDASTDSTARLCRDVGIQVIRRNSRGGSGAARKTGLSAARGTYVAMLDADGSYDPKCLPDLLLFLPAYDLVNGARTSEEGTWAPIRATVKYVIRKFAEILFGSRIPDLNTGMKVFKRELMLPYLWLIPNGFSCVTTMTLAFLCNGHRVQFVPIRYRKRLGKSKFRPVADTLRYIQSVLRLAVLLRPRRLVAILGALILGPVLIVSSRLWPEPFPTFVVATGVALIALMVLLCRSSGTRVGGSS
jgi:polyisoprenyl-phosphate glycosyltransferase